MTHKLFLTLSLLLLGCGTGSEANISLPNGNGGTENTQTDNRPSEEANQPDSVNPAEKDQVQTLYVNNARVICTGLGLRTCLQTRTDPNQDWTLFYDQIDGFEYEPGFNYQLRVKETHIANPPADASSIKRSLVEVVSKEAVTAQSLNNTKWVYTGAIIDNRPQPALAAASLSLDFTADQASGSAGCNRFFGGYEQNAAKLSFKPLASTKRACVDAELTQQENDFLQRLGEVSSLSMSEKRLTLYLDNQGQLNFQAAE